MLGAVQPLTFQLCSLLCVRTISTLKNYFDLKFSVSTDAISPFYDMITNANGLTVSDLVVAVVVLSLTCSWEVEESAAAGDSLSESDESSSTLIRRGILNFIVLRHLIEYFREELNALCYKLSELMSIKQSFSPTPKNISCKKLLIALLHKFLQLLSDCTAVISLKLVETHSLHHN